MTRSRCCSQRRASVGDENARPWLLCLARATSSAGTATSTSALELAREGQRGRRAVRSAALRRARPRAREPRRRRSSAAPRRRREAAAPRPRARPRCEFVELIASAALGHLELALGRPAEAASRSSSRASSFARAEGIVEPGRIRFVVDLVEALIELGRRDEAAELLDWYEANARGSSGRRRSPTARAAAACSPRRTAISTARIAAFEEALAWHAQVELPLDRGRTLLALGAAQRRAKRRREARATLEEALAVFERIGAALWAERARAELKRISGRAATPGALTPAEERVAALVAEGKTNREVAAALFLSDRTVEGHLSRVFGKLGIRHRAELGPALAARQTQGVARVKHGGLARFGRARPLPSLGARWSRGPPGAERGGAMTPQISLIIGVAALPSLGVRRRSADCSSATAGEQARRHHRSLRPDSHDRRHGSPACEHESSPRLDSRRSVRPSPVDRRVARAASATRTHGTWFGSGLLLSTRLYLATRFDADRTLGAQRLGAPAGRRSGSGIGSSGLGCSRCASACPPLPTDRVIGPVAPRRPEPAWSAYWRAEAPYRRSARRRRRRSRGSGSPGRARIS